MAVFQLTRREKMIPPFVLRYLYIHKHRTASIAAQMNMYSSAVMQVNSETYNMAGINTTAIDASIAKNELMLCFTATVSLIQSNLGKCRFITTPDKAQNTVTSEGSKSARRINAAENFIVIIHESDAINTAGRQTTTCILAFARSTLLPFMGRDCIIQRLFPSRDMEGADIKFVDAKKQMAVISSGLI